MGPDWVRQAERGHTGKALSFKHWVGYNEKIEIKSKRSLSYTDSQKNISGQSLDLKEKAYDVTYIPFKCCSGNS